jgi:hypothetical protein
VACFKILSRYSRGQTEEMRKTVGLDSQWPGRGSNVVCFVKLGFEGQCLRRSALLVSHAELWQIILDFVRVLCHKIEVT